MNGRQRSFAWALIGVVVMGLVLLAVVTIVRTTTLVELIREDQKAGQARSKETNRIANQIESCTTPAGECYQRSQRNTGAAVSTINEITVYAAACASQPATLAAPNVERRIELITACVQASLHANP